MSEATERQMLDLLAKRHSAVNKFGLPRYVYAEHVMHLPWGSEVDAIALDGIAVPYNERPMMPGATEAWHRENLPNDVHGYEVKVSRSDWLREVRTQGRKSMSWRGACSHWWIVVPDAAIVKPEELEPGWGLLAGTARLRTVVKATRNTDVSMSHELHIVIARHALRTATRSQ